jgi:hypothetical protein
MNKQEKDDYENYLNQNFEEIKRENKLDGDMSNDLIATPSRLGIDPSQKSEIDILEERFYTEYLYTVTNMAKLYLSNEKLLENEYIKDKIKNDASNLSDMRFLQDVAKKVIKKQVEQIELGEASPRFYETLSLHMKEIRDSIKQSTGTINTMEKFYLELRHSLGIEGDIKAKTNENENIPEVEFEEKEGLQGINTMDLQTRLLEIAKKNAEAESLKRKQ